MAERQPHTPEEETGGGYLAQESGQDRSANVATYEGQQTLAVRAPQPGGQQRPTGWIHTPAKWYKNPPNAHQRREDLYHLYLAKAQALDMIAFLPFNNKDKFITFIQARDYAPAYVLVDRVKDSEDLAQILSQVGCSRISQAICGTVLQTNLDPRPLDWPALKFPENKKIAEMPLGTKNSIANCLSNRREGWDSTYEILADILNMDPAIVSQFESKASHLHIPLAMPLFELWETENFATVGNLYFLLHVIGRSDIAAQLEKSG